MNGFDTAGTCEHAYKLMEEIERDEGGFPLTLEGAIRHVMLKSPDSFQYRDDALGILYCTLGSGIDWRDGRLQDRQPNNYLNLPPDRGEGRVWSSDHGTGESLDRMLGTNTEESRQLHKEVREHIQSGRDEQVARAVSTIQDIDERVQAYRGASWYPISWYGCNLCAPADAQPDFLDGAIETATLIIQHNPKPGTKSWMTHQRTKKYAEEILSVLMKRDGY